MLSRCHFSATESFSLFIACTQYLLKLAQLKYTARLDPGYSQDHNSTHHIVLL